MSDDATDDARLDDRLRAAMKSLDEQVPAGYFEALPNQILPRLEVTAMQTETPGKDQNETMTAPPSSADDSGLHDIRSLAETTKKRLSKKVTAQPSTEDVLASSSGSFRGIALPEPAKMVSLPALAELPSAAETKAKDKAAKAVKKAAPVEAKAGPAARDDDKAAVAAVVAATVAKPVAAIAAVPAFKAPGKAPANSNNTRTIALVGIGLAAAAGVVLMVSSRRGGEAAQAPQAVAQSAPPPPTARATAEAIAAPAAAPAPVEVAATGAAGGEGSAAVVVPPAGDAGPASATAHGKKPAAGKGSGKADDHTTVTATIIETPSKGEVPKAPGGTKGNGDPSFDDLLKEAGVQDGTKKEAAPTLAKKSLSTEDITHGMGALTKQAQGCYKGTQGQASVKLTVAPSGKVTKVTVGGVFAGTPEGQCVSSLAQGVSFPPWDGGPQTVNYSYLLSE